MADVELQQVWGAIEKGIGFSAPEIAGSTILYAITERAGYWTCERNELAAGPFVLKGKSSRAADGDEAHDWVQKDWPQFRNYLRWINYMAAYPPPS